MANRQQRLSKMCEDCAGQLCAAIRLSFGPPDESRMADMIYQYVRDFLHAEGESHVG